MDCTSVHVETRLKKRGGHQVNLNVIRNEVNETYSDDFLRELIEMNLRIFGLVLLKRAISLGSLLLKLN